jgi:potassium-dependent mechanosensitive channel
MRSILAITGRSVLFKSTLLVIIAVFATAVFGFAQVNDPAQPAADRQTPAPSPEPAATPVPLSELISEADAVSARIREIRARLVETKGIRSIAEKIPAIRQQVDEKQPVTLQALAAEPSLDDLRAMARDWQAIARNFPGWNRTFREAIGELDSYASELAALADLWNRTLASFDTARKLDGDPKNSTASPALPVPGEIVDKAKAAIDSIEQLALEVEERRSELLTLQSRTNEIEGRTAAVLSEIGAARDLRLSNLFVRDNSPIWDPAEEIGSIGSLFSEAWNSFKAQATIMRAYSANRTDRFALHALLFILLTTALYFARARVRPYLKKEPQLEAAAQIFETPVVTALLVAVLFSGWIYPEAPRLLRALMGAAALIPVVILLRRLVDRPLFTILNVLVILFVVDLVREILSGQPLPSRVIFLTEMLFALAFLIWFMWNNRSVEKIEAQHRRIFDTIQSAVPIVLVLFLMAFAANAIGFVSLGNIIGNGVLGSSYAALIIYTAAQILRSLLIFALRVPPLAKLAIVKNNRVLLREKAFKYISWASVVIWVLVVLNLFSISDAIFGFFRGFFAWSVDIGALNISLGDLAIFAITIWIAVLISRFIRFILEEDVYPRVDIGGGVSYAVSTMLHYAVLVLGLLIAVAALGIDFTKFAIVAGAVGIGVGFGLQTVVNNFVSGLILLFERPVKVGDTVQIGQHVGSLMQIGLRASVLRKIDGSDVVVPNSQLISEEVINWTMSDDRRRIDVPVGVAYGSDPEQVIELLTKVAVGREDVMSEPAPKTLFLGFGDNALNFELRFWTENTTGWVALRSEVVTAVYRALAEAKIEIPFPQRDLHLRSVDGEAARSLGIDRND